MKNYLKFIFTLIISNAIILIAIGFIDNWNQNTIISGIIGFSSLVVIAFLVYILIPLKNVKENNLLMTLVIFIPSIVFIFLFINNMIQLNSGEYFENPFTANKIKPWHIKLVQTILVLLSNIIMFKKYNKHK